MVDCTFQFASSSFSRIHWNSSGIYYSWWRYECTLTFSSHWGVVPLPARYMRLMLLVGYLADAEPVADDGVLHMIVLKHAVLAAALHHYFFSHLCLRPRHFAPTSILYCAGSKYWPSVSLRVLDCSSSSLVEVYALSHQIKGIIFSLVMWVGCAARDARTMLLRLVLQYRRSPYVYSERAHVDLPANHRRSKSFALRLDRRCCNYVRREKVF